MKISLLTVLFFIIVLLFSQCNNNADKAAKNNKDLGQNMQDMQIYHDNLGTSLRNKEMENAVWLLEGMDSSLLVIAANFDRHRKLTVAFEKTYQDKLQPVIKNIRTSLAENNFPNAISAYRVLTNNCNNCHKEHNVVEEVFDLSK